MKSENSLILSGRLTADATTNKEKNVANFAIAHNFTTDKVIYPKFVMFNKNGKYEKKIPFDLLKKGSAVKVEAYLYPDKDKDGKDTIQYVVKNVTALTKEEENAVDSPETNEAE